MFCLCVNVLFATKCEHLDNFISPFAFMKNGRTAFTVHCFKFQDKLSGFLFLRLRHVSMFVFGNTFDNAIFISSRSVIDSYICSHFKNTLISCEFSLCTLHDFGWHSYFVCLLITCVASGTIKLGRIWLWLDVPEHRILLFSAFSFNTHPCSRVSRYI